MESYRDHHQSNSDIICEILSRSSPETLARCRLLSREYNNFTYESYFMSLHSERTNTTYGYFVQSLGYIKRHSTYVSFDNSSSLCKQLSLHFLPVGAQIVASTNQGILLYVDNSSRIPKYFVCKPCTREWEKIPNPKTKYFSKGFGMLVMRTNPLHYKIVRFSEVKPGSDYRSYVGYRLRCEIFESKTKAWKRVDDVELGDSEFLIDYKPSVSAWGSLHWLTTKNNVLAFHEDKEVCRLISLPTEASYEKESFELVKYEGKLALVCMRRTECSMELYVLENYERKEWKKRKEISVDAVREVETSARPLGFYSSDVALMLGFYQVLFFNFNNGSIGIAKLDGLVDGLFSIQSDFEPSNLIGGIVYPNSRGKGTKKKIRVEKTSWLAGLRALVVKYLAFVVLFLLVAFTCICFSFDL